MKTNKLLIPLNIQFFAKEGEGDGTGNSSDGDGNSTPTDGADGGSAGGVDKDIEALAELISDKDKQIQQLEKDITELKKSNASLLVKVSAGAAATQTKTFDENLLDLVGAKPRKE